MNNQTSQENPSLLPTTTTTTKDDSPRKLPGGGGGGGGGDRLKRDEWSEGAVSTLLEAYESKWVLRNRAKLKGHDWEDVARYVSMRANSTKSPKTQTQCKNKIESMKKRYRSESATADGSSWPLYPRLDLLLRGSGLPQPPPPPPAPPPPPPPLLQVVPVPNNIHPPPPLMLLEPSPILQEPPATVPPPPISSLRNTAQNSHGSNGVERVAKEDGDGARLSDNFSDKNIAMESTDCSTPAALYSDKEKPRCKKMKMKQQMDYNNKNNNNKKRSSTSRRPDHHHHHHNHQEVEIAESIRWLAQVVVRSEQARMDTMREIEKMRIEAEAKRGELELKRTEIIANTQLEIAKIFATVNKGVDSSLRIGRS